MTTYKFATFNGRIITVTASSQYEANEKAKQIAEDWGTLVRRRA
jgi:hypothetical protein